MIHPMTDSDAVNIIPRNATRFDGSISAMYCTKAIIKYSNYMELLYIKLSLKALQNLEWLATVAEVAAK